MLTLFLFGSFLIVVIACFIINYRDKDRSLNSIGDWVYDDFYEIDMQDILFFEPEIKEVSAVNNENEKLIYSK